ncbi:MAG: glycosyltransferase [Methanomicrobiales archaeon]|nr:glycosyltransferase [Methanomicrobiales archaeon]
MISVIVPSFNEEKNIGRCLASLSVQTLPRDQYEIIVVDGNSKDRTREIAMQYADQVFIQTSPRVGGARNDGALRAKGDILATTDADCIIPPEWLVTIRAGFRKEDTVQVYGPVDPIEPGIGNRLSLALANTFSTFGYCTGTLYYTLGCNTAFRRDAFIAAGMYRISDAGDDLEIALRMKKRGDIKFIRRMRVGFSMRRYEQFGTLKSLYEWLYITFQGGESGKYSYTQRKYK